MAGEDFGCKDMDDINDEVLRITERFDCICEKFAGHSHDPETFSDIVDCIESDISRISNEMEDLFNGGFDQIQAVFNTIKMSRC